MTPAQTELARRRLWLGITNVGLWVLAAAGGLCWLVANGTGASHPGDTGGWTFLGVGVTALAVQAGFDFLGGTWLMPTPGEFLGRWSRGVLGHTAAMAVVGLLSLASFRLTGGFVPAVLLATVGLALGRRSLLHAVGGVTTEDLTTPDGERVMVAAGGATDPAFIGGIVGFGRRAVSLLPAAWLQDLPREELAAESSRRRWQVGHAPPGRTLLLILGWNLLGAHVGTLAFRLAERTPAAALFGHACWMTLWTFGSLLVLPALSRRAVFGADRASADAGHDPRAWIARFPGLVGEDGGANPAVQAIFYPVPSAARRLERLDRPFVGFVPGNLARNNLFYSWAAFTPLGRAVHCNVGRPALWVFPPSA